MTKRLHKGFTLIELMVVVGIIGLLMLIAIPAFQGADRGGRIRASVFQLNSTMSLARQTAISQRDTVYVVFPEDDPAIFAGNPSLVQNALRSYAVYSRRDGYIGEWRVLPPGVLFHPEYGTNTVNIFGRNDCQISLPFPDSTSPNRTLTVLGFRADGPIHAGGSTPAAIYVTDGSVDYNIITGGITPPPLFLTNVVMGIDFNAITGQSRIREL